jgi:hypothetical protein
LPLLPPAMPWVSLADVDVARAEGPLRECGRLNAVLQTEKFNMALPERWKLKIGNDLRRPKISKDFVPRLPNEPVFGGLTERFWRHSQLGTLARIIYRSTQTRKPKRGSAADLPRWRFGLVWAQSARESVGQ